ncbi:antibiotic biosynthesis monooxygenase family protein [Massilia soli]|uniref:Antibiotic biosynthesis monooxygenase n=1 Tax=Massilia soli TaxID=2792854 RepID=A0ABS7SM16_9BURK|nr:antibiotic biosynthesis monooxygenase [Massilia soli]MBZ2206989.1 antibiotic biosynthesis monooxygenase [Massilia soli]
MIYEIASIPVRTDQIDAFKTAFGEVTHLLARAKGYEGHLLTQGVETPSLFSLIVQWQTLEDHTQVFEPSEDHLVFMTGLQAYFAAEPSVCHVRAAFPHQGMDLSAQEMIG